MASSTILAQVRPGMQVRSADGTVLGNITGVASHGTETYLEVTPGPWVTIWRPFDHLARVYLPGAAVTAVSGARVTLSMDAKMARACKLRPNWFAGPTTTNLKSW